MCEGGELFTWGQNAHGQLGVSSQTALILKPQLVERLKGIPLAQIAAGGAHNVAVSLSGAVYSWGKNDFGQLGLGHTRGKEEQQQEGVFLVSELTADTGLAQECQAPLEEQWTLKSLEESMFG